MVELLWRIVWKRLKKLNIELPYDPKIPFLGIHMDKSIILSLPRTKVKITPDSTVLPSPDLFFPWSLPPSITLLHFIC